MQDHFKLENLCLDNGQGNILANITIQIVILSIWMIKTDVGCQKSEYKVARLCCQTEYKVLERITAKQFLRAKKIASKIRIHAHYMT